MSVGVEFDEEEGELAPHEGLSERLLGTYESIASNSHQQQEQVRLANRSRMERVSRDSAAGGTGASSSFFVFNSFSHSSSGTNAADGGGGASEGVNNYYTSLLTGNCFKAHHSESSLLEQSLRQTLTDPFSGELMDDAVIFPCGHSFGSAGVQKIQETNMCYVCQLPTRAADACINLALRAVVQAFRLDRGMPKGASRTAKRRRDSDAEDGGRPKGVQFPYVVSDRVLIKGNKRTPERFVGKQAIITTQCLNGWYLVRTIDNGESVRLQYRSLEKIEDETSWHQGGSAPATDYVSTGN